MKRESISGDNMMKIENFQHTKKPKVSCVPETQRVSKDAKNRRFLSMKQLFTIIFVLMLTISIVYAHGEETFAVAESIIESKIPCEQLDDNQLEYLGDYFMEQMHPGEAHEAMDEMMGGEGSDNLKQMHINMARSFYCGDHDSLTPGMMNTMMGGGMMGSGMMSGGMMGNSINTLTHSNRGGLMNMMYGFGLSGFLYMIIFWGLIIWLIVWLITKYSKKDQKSPMEILKIRYAKGEITKKQFEEMKKELK